MRPPSAFFSYVRGVDEHDAGRLTRLRERLQGEIRVQTGMAVEIFQDVRDIKWGDHWREEILESLAEAYFLIPVITPGYFVSEPCREEYEAFRQRQERMKPLEGGGLVLPIYYVETDEMSDPAWREGNAWAEELCSVQWADWRLLRLEPWESRAPNVAVEKMARQFKDRIKAMGALRPPGGPPVVSPAKTPAARSTPAAEARPAAMQPQVGAAPLPHRRELVVDAAGKAAFTSIGDALRTAGSDDIVLVKPGTYREAIVLDKSITLIGDGLRDAIVIESHDGNTLRSTAPFGRVANLTFRQTGETTFYCVAMAAGQITLEQCDVSGAGGGVAVYGSASPTLVRNRIHDCRGAGIFVYEDGRGTFEDNDVFANTLAGIEVRDSGDPTVRRNRIHDGKGSGILVHNNARGTFEDNDVSANALTGIQVARAADPIVRRNRFHEAKQGGGIFVYENGRGTFEDNEIFANALAGIQVQEGADPAVRRNRIHDGKSAGILVHTNGRGTFEDNDVWANVLAGVQVATGADPTVRRNRLHEAKQGGGVFIYDTGRGLFEDNDVFANAFAGIQVQEGGDPVVRRNRIRDGKTGGILVQSEGRGTFEENDVCANAQAGIAVATGGQPVVRRNRVNKNGYEGIWVYDGGRGTFVDNDLRDNTRGPWDVAPACLEQITREGNVEP
jgi:parallel beta-helix repeat protein